MPILEIYTDGACSGNPGAGGWGAILRYGGIEKELSGAVAETNQQPDGADSRYEALKALRRDCEIVIHTDSRYVMDGVQEWLPNWKKKQLANQQ